MPAQGSGIRNGQTITMFCRRSPGWMRKSFSTTARKTPPPEWKLSVSVPTRFPALRKKPVATVPRPSQATDRIACVAVGATIGFLLQAALPAVLLDVPDQNIFSEMNFMVSPPGTAWSRAVRSVFSSTLSVPSVR